MKGIQVHPPVWEDSMCQGAIKPMCLESMLLNRRSHHNEKPCTAMKSRLCSPQLEKAQVHSEDPAQQKKKKKEMY